MHRRASSIVRALLDTSRDANAVAPLHCTSLKSGAVLDPPCARPSSRRTPRARDVGSALALFDEAVAPDVTMWNPAINASTLNCCYDDAVVLFRRMADVHGVFDSTTVVIILSGASRAGNLEHGVALHGAAMKRCLDTVLSLFNALVDMYAKCGDFYSSEAVFRRMQYWDTTSWNSMIGGSTFNGLAEISAHYFREMTRLAIQADEASLSSVLSACSHLDDLFSFGESVHSCVVKLGYEDTASCSAANSLITFYSEPGFPEAAEKAIVSTSNKNLVSWNATIQGLVENREPFIVFREMISENQPDVAALVTIISACGEQGLPCEGKAIHGYITRKGLLHEESSIVNSLLDLYFKCDNPSTASILFRTMPRGDLISWNTMISVYSRNDSLREEAQAMFKGLLSDGLSCSLATILAVIPSCSCPEGLSFGKAVHSFSLKYGFASRVSAVNALMHMYISCGGSLAAFAQGKYNVCVGYCFMEYGRS